MYDAMRSRPQRARVLRSICLRDLAGNTIARIVKFGSSIAPTTSLALALSGLLACACSSGGTAGASDGGAGRGGTATSTKYGAVIVEAPGLATDTPAYIASAAFSDLPRLLQAGEQTSLDFGIGEPDGCTKSTVGDCLVYRCPKTIEATPTQFVEPNVGAITISWPPASGPDGGDSRPPLVMLGPLNCYGLVWQTGTPVPRFGFSAAGGTIPAFPATDVDVPQLFEVTQLNGNPVGPDSPTIPRAASLRVTWTGGTGDAVFVLQQRQVGSDNDLRAVCRVAASAGSVTFSSGVIGEFQPGDASFDASVVSSKMVAAGDYATTLAIGAPLPSHFPFAIE